MTFTGSPMKPASTALTCPAARLLRACGGAKRSHCGCAISSSCGAGSRYGKNAVQLGAHVTRSGPTKDAKTRSVPVPAFVLNRTVSAVPEPRPRSDEVFPGQDGALSSWPKSSGGWFAAAVTRAKGPENHAARPAPHLRVAGGVGRGQRSGAATHARAHVSKGHLGYLQRICSTTISTAVAVRLLIAGIHRQKVRPRMWPQRLSGRPHLANPKNSGPPAIIRRTALAVAEGFEPSDGVSRHTLSRRAP